MTSMQEALTEELEHPSAKPPGRPKPYKKPKSRGVQPASHGASSLVWGLAGLAASVILYGISRKFVKAPPVAVQETPLITPD